MMPKIFLSLMFICVFSNCRPDKNRPVGTQSCAATNIRKSGKKFEMYKMSEMSALMEQMYADNERLKKRIENGDTVGKFPNHFMQIHKADMTDGKENDAFFKQQAANFINAQQLIYDDPKYAQQHFNDGVDACVSCHRVKCAGPIPRIKKLYIKN